MTDKKANGLLEIYERHFSYLKDQPITLVEIGVLAGESLDWFASYFKHPKTKIIGVDVKLPTKRKDERIELLQASQIDDWGFEADIILDDASHEAHLTRQTFDNQWKNVKPNGWYVIEDWHGAVLPEMESMVWELAKSTEAPQRILYRNDKPLAATALFKKG